MRALDKKRHVQITYYTKYSIIMWIQKAWGLSITKCNRPLLGLSCQDKTIWCSFPPWHGDPESLRSSIGTEELATIWLDLNIRSPWQGQIKPIIPATACAQARNQWDAVRLQEGRKWHATDSIRDNDLSSRNIAWPRGLPPTGFRSRCQVTHRFKK